MIQHQVQVHRHFEEDEDEEQNVSGSIEEYRFLTTTEVENKNKNSKKSKNKPKQLERMEDLSLIKNIKGHRSRSLQRNSKFDVQPKSRARSSDPVLSRGRKTRYGMDSREIDLDTMNQGRYVSLENGDIYATVNKNRIRGRSPSPQVNHQNKNRSSSKENRRSLLPLSRASDNQNQSLSSISTIVNSNARSSVTFNGKSPSSTIKAHSSNNQNSNRQDISFNNQVNYLKNSIVYRSGNLRKFGDTLTVPSSTMTPPIVRRSSQEDHDEHISEDYQLPPSTVLQKLGKTYRSISPRKPHRSPKISAHSVKNRKPLNSEFFQINSMKREDEDGDDEYRSSYPSSSVESTPRGISSGYMSNRPSRSLRLRSPLPLSQNTNKRNQITTTSDKNSGANNVSIPLIKINSKNLPKVDAAFLKSSIRNRKPTMIQEDTTYPTDRSAER